VIAQSNGARLRRQRNVVLALLLALAGACWLVVLRQAGMTQGMGLAMGDNAAPVPPCWVAMMIAMMFPTAAPMIVMFGTVAAGKQQAGAALRPDLGVCECLPHGVDWLRRGSLRCRAASRRWRLQSTWLMGNAARLGGGVLLLGGVYQLSPLKSLCLTKSGAR